MPNPKLKESTVKRLLLMSEGKDEKLSFSSTTPSLKLHTTELSVLILKEMEPE